MSTEEYNGWTNYETWNVTLYLNNDEGTYLAIKEYVNAALVDGERPNYDDLIEYLGIGEESTPDGVRWDYFRIDRAELYDWLMDYADPETQKEYSERTSD